MRLLLRRLECRICLRNSVVCINYRKLNLRICRVLGGNWVTFCISLNNLLWIFRLRGLIMSSWLGIINYINRELLLIFNIEFSYANIFKIKIFIFNLTCPKKPLKERLNKLSQLLESLLLNRLLEHLRQLRMLWGKSTLKN